MTARFDIFAERIYTARLDANNITKLAQATRATRTNAGFSTLADDHDCLIQKDSKVFMDETNDWLQTQGLITEYTKFDSNIQAVEYQSGPDDHLLPRLTMAVSVFNKNAHFELFGDPARVKEMKQLIVEQWSDNNCKVYKAHYNQENGRVVSSRVSIVKDETTQPYDCFYPFIKKPIEEYYEDYFRAKESLLLLIGEPGTGKSTLLRGMCFKRGDQTLLCNDAEAIESGEIFRYFSNADFDLLILEDADRFLIPREDGNSMMSTLLNEADGIVKQPQKKIVISTNLSSLNKVDVGLVRPGRCYDVLKFEPLNAEEIRVIEIERQLDPCQSVATATLSEVLNYKTQAETKHKAVKLGFAV